jgi:hypothetical protein
MKPRGFLEGLQSQQNLLADCLNIMKGESNHMSNKNGSQLKHRDVEGMLTKEGMKEGRVLGDDIGAEMRTSEESMGHQHPQQESGNEGPEDLTHDVTNCLDRAGHASCNHAQCDCRIHMAARVVADHIDDGANSKAESECDNEGVQHDICMGREHKLPSAHTIGYQIPYNNSFDITKCHGWVHVIEAQGHTQVSLPRSKREGTNL